MTLGTIIATRQLTLDGPDGARPVIVRIGRPRRQRTGEWACPFRIAGLGRQRLDHAYGEDAFQALQLALEAIRIQLETARQKVTWLGLPVAVAFPRQVPAFDEDLTIRLGRLIDGQVIRWARKARDRGRHRGSRR